MAKRKSTKMTNNDQQKIVIKKGREKDNAFVSHC
jgi:hypothetical protein